MHEENESLFILERKSFLNRHIDYITIMEEAA